MRGRIAPHQDRSDAKQTLEQTDAETDKRNRTEQEQQRRADNGRTNRTSPTNGRGENLTNGRKQRRNGYSGNRALSQKQHTSHLTIIIHSLNVKETLEQADTEADKGDSAEQEQQRRTDNGFTDLTCPADGSSENRANRRKNFSHFIHQLSIIFFYNISISTAT